MSGATMTMQQAAGALQAAGWPAALWPVMVAIGQAESGLQLDAVDHDSDGTTDTGWLQVNSVHGYDPAVLVDPIGCAKAARNIYAMQGLRAWATYTSGAYAQYLPAATAAARNPQPPPAGAATVVSDAAQPVGALGDLGQLWARGFNDLTSPFGGPSVPANPLGGLDSLGRALGSLATLGVHAAAWIGDPHNWLRVVEVIAGSVGVLIGLRMLADAGVGGPLGAAAGAATAVTNHAARTARHAAGAAALA